MATYLVPGVSRRRRIGGRAGGLRSSTFDRLFDEMWGSTWPALAAPPSAKRGFVPRVDVDETVLSNEAADREFFLDGARTDLGDSPWARVIARAASREATAARSRTPAPSPKSTAPIPEAVAAKPTHDFDATYGDEAKSMGFLDRVYTSLAAARR